jgi:hypothetical protein
MTTQPSLPNTLNERLKSLESEEGLTVKDIIKIRKAYVQHWYPGLSVQDFALHLSETGLYQDYSLSSSILDGGIFPEAGGPLIWSRSHGGIPYDIFESSYHSVSLVDYTRLSLYVNQIPRPMQWALTEENVNLFRKVIMSWWTERWLLKRAEYQEQIAELMRAVPSKKEASVRKIKGLMKKRQMKAELPTDLSGACKVVSQVGKIVFNIRDLAIVSNKSHTFMYSHASGQHMVLDFNSECADVASMKQPYLVDPVYHLSATSMEGLESWHPVVASLAISLLSRNYGLSEQPNVLEVSTPVTVPKLHAMSISKDSAWIKRYLRTAHRP